MGNAEGRREQERPPRGNGKRELDAEGFPVVELPTKDDPDEKDKARSGRRLDRFG